MSHRVHSHHRVSTARPTGEVAAVPTTEEAKSGREVQSGFGGQAPAALASDAGAQAAALSQNEALGVFSPGALMRGADQIHRSLPTDPIQGGDSSTLTAPGADLAQGSSGAAVEQLQHDLVALGYLSQADMNTGPGIYGPHTRAAVAKLQNAHGITGNDGVNYGPRTRAALQAALANLSQPAPTPNPTPAPSGNVPSVNLQRGATGDQVKVLQNDLVHLGYMSQADMNTGPGIYGPHTQSAVSAFQAAWGLPVDGACGPATRAKLAEAMAGARPPAPAPSSGGDASSIARQYLGRNISDLKYNSSLDLDKWPGNNVCCANFVSACLEKAGRIPANQHNDSVVGLVGNLRADGYTEIPLSQAQPGDVVTFDGPEGAQQHVELFNAWVNGHPQYVGSNNINSDGSQRISYDTGAWAYHVHVYHKS